MLTKLTRRSKKSKNPGIEASRPVEVVEKVEAIRGSTRKVIEEVEDAAVIRSEVEKEEIFRQKAKEVADKVEKGPTKAESPVKVGQRRDPQRPKVL